MYRTIERLYRKTGNKVVVANAVAKGWITEAEYALITGEAYAETAVESAE